MFVYEKKLEYPVRILRYLSQRYAMPYPELSALLTDIGTEAAEMALQIEA